MSGINDIPIVDKDKITPRVLFAAAALQGMLANPKMTDYKDDALVASSVILADKMIAEMNKEVKP